MAALAAVAGVGAAPLLVCCAAFRGDAGRWPNLTIKKIPKMVLQKCEWGHDDYSLNVANLPMAQPDPEPVAAASDGIKKKRKASPGQAGLFGDNDA